MNITHLRARAGSKLKPALAALALPLLFVSFVPATAQSSNNAPVAKARSAKVKEGKSKNIKLKGNDKDGQELTFEIVAFPQHGQLEMLESTKKGKVRYTPDEGYSGEDFFSFTVSDGTMVSEPATVSLTVFKKGFAPTGPSLTAAEVQQIVQTAALAINDPQAVITVIDRPGNVLAVYRRPGASQNDIDRALALARAGAFFSSDEAPLSSRTIRVLGGIHFPAQIAFTPSSDLYGIELTNRGCDYNVDFNPGKAYPRSTSFGSDRPGLGIGTGKADLLDSDPNAVDPGGFPLYKNRRLAGGIGVTVPFPRNVGVQGPNAQVTASEFAAFSAAAPGLIPLLPLAFPGRVILGGLELPFSPYLDAFEQAREIPLPPGAGNGSFNPNHFVFGPVAGTHAPEGYLVGPLAGSKLTAAEVNAIVQRGITEANRTRAAIRLPVGKPAKMCFGVADTDGTILAVFRQEDATVFSIDVALTKSRNVVYLSSPEGDVDTPGLPLGTAITALTLYFGGQPLFPIGIDGTDPGPFYNLFVQDALNPCTQGSQRRNPNQSGIVWFPGSSPLYKGNTLVGGFGVSGDGVTQDNVVTVAGIVGLEAPLAIQSDQFMIRGVRMPYLKFNRNPFVP